MMQRDLKIGLVAGLVLVIVVVIKFAVDPRLSPEARMMQLNNSTENEGNSDSNEELQNPILGEISSTSETAGALTSQPEQIFNELPVQIQLSEENAPQPEVAGLEKQEDSMNNEIHSVSLETQNPDSILTTGDTKDILSAAIEPAIGAPKNFDYDKAEVIKTEKFHFVLKNETLSDISRKYYGSAGQWKKIVDANPDLIKDPNKIKSGMKLIIP